MDLIRCSGCSTGKNSALFIDARGVRRKTCAKCRVSTNHYTALH